MNHKTLKTTDNMQQQQQQQQWHSTAQHSIA